MSWPKRWSRANRGRMRWFHFGIGVFAMLSGLTPVHAGAAELRCGDILAAASVEGGQHDIATIIEAAAVISRSSGAAIVRRAGAKDWRKAPSGTLLAAGDQVCASGPVGWVVVRTPRGRLTQIDITHAPFRVDGPKYPSLPKAAHAFLTGLDWPSLAELTAIERSLTGSGRTRGGMTRGMSIGSTPRAVFLEGESAFAGIVTQRIDSKLARLLWGWCGGAQSGDMISKNQTVTTLESFRPLQMASKKGVDSLRLTDNAGAFKVIGLAWVAASDLPRPDWMKGEPDPLLWGLWLAEHPSGEYRIQGYSMLDRIAADRPSASHYLAHHSNCGQGYHYRPALPGDDG